MKEAEEINKYMVPFDKYVGKIESVEFNETKPHLHPLLHVVCLIWCNCKYYCSSAKIINLLQLICNLIIEQVLFILLHFLHLMS